MKSRNPVAIVLILGALSTISPFSIDMYLPAFAEMALALGTTPARIALSLSSYFIGLSLGQVVYGPLLDRFGRKPPLYVGLTIFVLASLGCSQAATVEQLIVFRFLQALGGCSAQVAAITMVRDFFPTKDTAKILSLLLLVIGLSPLFAPTVGSFVVGTLGWQSVFYVLGSIVALILTVVYFVLPEAHAPDLGISLKPGPVLREFKSIASTPAFRTYALSGAFSLAGLFVYVAASPLIFMHIFEVSARTYGIIFACLSVGFIGGSQVNIFLSRYYSSETIFRHVLRFQVLVTACFAVTASLGGGTLGVSLGFICVTLSCVGLTNPNASALALAPFSRNAGSASALLGFTQMGLGALASASVGLVGSRGLAPLTYLFFASSLMAWLLLLNGRRLAGKSTY